MKSPSNLGEVISYTTRGVTVLVYGTLRGFSVGASMGSTILVEHGLTFESVGDATTRLENAVRYAAL